MAWKTVKLGEVCDCVCSGGTPNSRNSKYYDGGIPWLNTKEIDFGRIYSTERTISQEGLENSSAKWIDENSVIVAMYGATAGKVAVSKIRLTTNQACCNLHIDEKKADYNFVYYYLLDNFSILASLANGGAQQNLNAQIIKDFLISLPPLETQRRIAAILSSLDDKIENNNCINRNLEAQAQALFKSWFVDFEPWGGTMPEDWKEYQLTEFAEIISGYSYKGAELLPSEDAMATIKNFDRKGYFKLDGYKEIQISGRLKNTQILNLFDVIVAHTDITQQADIIGNPAIILSKGGYRNIIMSMDLCKVQPTHYAISSAFLYCLLKDIRFKSHALGYVNGTTVLHMSKKALPEYRVFLPNDLSKVQELGDRLQNLYKRYSINLEESARLAALRDTLLPKLMRGEINL